jgi:hypothetical protein
MKEEEKDEGGRMEEKDEGGRMKDEEDGMANRKARTQAGAWVRGIRAIQRASARFN